MLNTRESYPKEKLTIIGGGIIGAIEAYYAYLEAKKSGKQLRITIHEKNHDLSETTTAHLVPSITPDEILAVVPHGAELIKKLNTSFKEPGGLRVDDVADVNDTAIAKHFIDFATQCDSESIKTRRDVLLKLGKLSVSLWNDLYDNADPTLKQILDDSNFKPHQLHNGYRMDLFYKQPAAENIAKTAITEYLELGYSSSKILSPEEVIAHDPFLKDFCENNSIVNEFGERQWKLDATAMWRPGGCIDLQSFLPKFYNYLKTEMGTYVNADGETKDCFQLKFDRNVIGVDYEIESEKQRINGLRFFGRESKLKKSQHQTSNYVFCPGENVGTLQKLGFAEPAYAGFAGPSLMLYLSIPDDWVERYAQINQYMEIQQENIGAAWQVRLKNNKIFMGMAGGKAFYSDQLPNKDQEFATNRHLLQLNVMNDLLPEFISLALSRNTKGQTLVAADLHQLEQAGIATRWVGRRAVAYDIFPTVGELYHNDKKVENGRTTTQLGSGGGSFSLATVFASRSTLKLDMEPDKLIKDVLKFGCSKR